MATFVQGSGSEKVTINGEKVRKKMNLIYDGVLTYPNKVSNLPYYSTNDAVLLYKGKIHLLGGDVDNNNSHHEWDGNSWIKLGNLKYNFSGQGNAVVYKDEIHIVGSSTSGEERKYHLKWNDSTDTWTRYKDLPSHFQNRSAVVYKDELYIPGVYTIPYLYKWGGKDNDTWEKIIELPIDNCTRGVTVVCSDGIHLLACSNNTSREDSHYVWNGGTSWKKLEDLPIIVRDTHAVSVNDVIFLLGGVSYSSDGSGSQITTDNNKGYYYVWNGVTWHSLNMDTYTPLTYKEGCAVVVDEEVHELGSYSTKSTNYNHHRIIGKTMLKEV